MERSWVYARRKYFLVVPCGTEGRRMDTRTILFGMTGTCTCSDAHGTHRRYRWPHPCPSTSPKLYHCCALQPRSSTQSTQLRPPRPVLSAKKSLTFAATREAVRSHQRRRYHRVSTTLLYLLVYRLPMHEALWVHKSSLGPICQLARA